MTKWLTRREPLSGSVTATKVLQQLIPVFDWVRTLARAFIRGLLDPQSVRALPSRRSAHFRAYDPRIAARLPSENLRGVFAEKDKYSMSCTVVCSIVHCDTMYVCSGNRVGNWIFTVRTSWVLCEPLLVLCVVCAGYEIPQRLKKAAFEGALAISKKKKAAKGKNWSEMICRTECVILIVCYSILCAIAHNLLYVLDLFPFQPQLMLWMEEASWRARALPHWVGTKSWSGRASQQRGESMPPWRWNSCYPDQCTFITESCPWTIWIYKHLYVVCTLAV